MKDIVDYGHGMTVSKFTRFWRNLAQLPAWFAPWKRYRTFFHRLKGVNIGKRVEIGYMVLIDNRRPELVTIEDDVTLTTMCVVIAHDLSPNFNEGKEIIGKVLIKKGAFQKSFTNMIACQIKYKKKMIFMKIYLKIIVLNK